MKKQRLWAFLLCVVLLMSLLPGTAWAEGPIIEYVDYDIEENTTWHAGVYYICKTEDNREPRVTNGATLTIESGAKVYFSTRTTTELPESDGKYPYSSLTVTKGSLAANDVTFTTVPDNSGETTWQDAGWHGIRAVGSPDGATSLSFTGCIFEYSGSNDDGTLYGTQTNGVDSVVNISVSGCTFRDPSASTTTAIRYNNGHNTVGTGTISVSGSAFSGYGRGVQVADNQEDAVNITVTGCTFSSMSIRPLEINGGRQASVTDCTFNTFVAGQHDGAVLIFNTYSATSQTQTVTLTGNTFNYGDTANIYPILIGAGTQINKNLTTDAENTFDANYPEDFQYIQLTRGVGYLATHRNAVWGDAGIPYLLTSGIVVGGTDEENQSSLIIEPGVTVCLGDGEGADNLTVRGTLTAEGTPAKPITFTKKTGVTYGNEIAASNKLKGSIALKHCIMDGLYRGIGVTSPSTVAGLISMENCTVRNTQHSMSLAGCNVLVKNCTLIGKGIGTDGGDYINSIRIEGCSITASGAGSDYGVFLQPAKSVMLKNCLITGFPKCGVYVINNDHQTVEAGAPLIENCTITGNGYGVVFYGGYFSTYGAYIRNSIIKGNTGLDLVNRVYISGESINPVTIVDGSVAYSLIGDDETEYSNGGNPWATPTYDHDILGKIAQIPDLAYSNRVTGDPLFANAAVGDYHLQSATGRWNGSTWVRDAATSPCIDAGDPSSAYGNEPNPNGSRINLGCYGNTAEASKSSGGDIPDPTPSVTVTASPSGNVGLGTSVMLTATLASIEDPSYAWYSTTDSAIGGSVISGATNATYQPSTSTVGTTYYYCVVNEVTSNVVGVTVTSEPSITHTITATAGANGRISPSGTVTVNHGGSQEFTITPNTGYRISDVRVNGSSVGAVSRYTFSDITEGQIITASFVSRSSSYTPPSAPKDESATSITIPEVKPDQSAAAEVSITANAGANGMASAAIPDKAITDAIEKAQKSAKAQGKTSFAVELDVTMPKETTSLTAMLSRNALQSLVSAGVTSLELNGAPVSVSFDQKALEAILSQSSGNVTIGITPVKALSDSVKALVGERPVYEITVSYVKDDRTTTISNFSSGSITLAIPYTPGKNEASGYLYGVYVDENGKVIRITGSAYDPNKKAVLIPTTHLSVYGIGYTAPSAKFTDIANHMAKEVIDYVVGRGLFSGTSGTTFSPDTAMSRGMLITVLGKLSGDDVSSYKENNFTDVAADLYYAPYIEWAYQKGIIQGIGNGRFAPDRAVTREEIAIIIKRYAKATGYTLPVTFEATAYEDDSSIGSNYRAAITAMQQAGIMMGGSSNKFSPKDSVTRAEIAAILHHYVKLTTEPDTAQGWVLTDAGQWFYYKDGKALIGEQTINGVKYCFSNTGELQTGWVKDGDNWRFYDGNKMLIGWWNSGSDTAKKTYYFDIHGNMVTGKWLEINGKWYYFNPDGSLARNTTIDGHEVDENGVKK